MSRFEAEQARLRAQIERAPPSYVDRVLDDADTDTPTAGADAAAPSPEGVRSWLFESRVGRGSSGSSGGPASRAGEAGMHAEYRRETLNYGDWLLQFDGRAAGGDRRADLSGAGGLGTSSEPNSGRFGLRVLGLPLTPTRFLDATLGDFYAERTEGLQRYDRLALGTTPLRGASLRLFDAESEIRLGLGRRGWMVGSPYPGFERSQGMRAWLGLTRRIGNDAFVAVQVEQASDVPAFYVDPLTGQGQGAKDVRSLAASVGRNPGPLREGEPRLRVTMLASSVASPTAGVAQGTAIGLFGEGALRLGSFRHTLGAYAAQPNLHYGDAPVLTGVQGGHWRVDTSSARLSWGMGVDVDRTPLDPTRAGADRTRLAWSGNGQYLIGRETTMGASLMATDARSRGQAASSAAELTTATAQPSAQRSLAASLFLQSRFMDLPRSRLALNLQRNRYVAADSDAVTGQELSWEQDWFDLRTSHRGTEFTTTLGYARERSGSTTQHYPTAGLQFRQSLGSRFDVQGNLRYTAHSSNLFASRGLSGSVSLDSALAPGWRIGASLILNQARTAMVATSLDVPQIYRSSDRSFFVFLRWQGQEGQAFVPLGDRRAGAGTGDIQGRVFLDADRDGVQRPGETGVGSVEVILDGRYRTTTDRDGRFEFATVTTGRHQISVAPESVPLPWSDGGAAWSVDVPLRGTGHVQMPLVREAP